MGQIDNFYLNQSEPTKSCLLTLRDIILEQDENVSASFKYGMPFFCYKNKMFCYLWVHKKSGQPYIGFVEGKHIEHKNLLQEKRSRMKILLLDADKDLPVKTIEHLLKKALDLYRLGKIKV